MDAGKKTVYFWCFFCYNGNRRVTARLAAAEMPARSFHMSGKEVLQSEMVYRNTQVSMGLPGMSEFELWRTSEAAVSRAKAVIMRYMGQSGAIYEGGYLTQILSLKEKFQKIYTKRLTFRSQNGNISFARCVKRECRNWQTSQTKDLVIIAIVRVQVPSRALV